MPILSARCANAATNLRSFTESWKTEAWPPIIITQPSIKLGFAILPIKPSRPCLLAIGNPQTQKWVGWSDPRLDNRLFFSRIRIYDWESGGANYLGWKLNACSLPDRTRKRSVYSPSQNRISHPIYPLDPKRENVAGFFVWQCSRLEVSSQTHEHSRNSNLQGENLGSLSRRQTQGRRHSFWGHKDKMPSFY